VGDHAEAVLREEQQLSVPSIGVERPAVGKGDRRSCAPILVVDFRSVSRCDRGHDMPPGEALVEEQHRTERRAFWIAERSAWTGASSDRRHVSMPDQTGATRYLKMRKCPVSPRR